MISRLPPHCHTRKEISGVQKETVTDSPRLLCTAPSTTPTGGPAPALLPEAQGGRQCAPEHGRTAAQRGQLPPDLRPPGHRRKRLPVDAATRLTSANISVTRAPSEVHTSHHNSEWSAMPQESWRGKEGGKNAHPSAQWYFLDNRK